MLETYVQWLNLRCGYDLYNFEVTSVESAVNKLVHDYAYSYTEGEQVIRDITAACKRKAGKYFDAYRGVVYSLDEMKKMMKEDMSNEGFINFCKELEKKEE